MCNISIFLICCLQSQNYILHVLHSIQVIFASVHTENPNTVVGLLNKLDREFEREGTDTQFGNFVRGQGGKEGGRGERERLEEGDGGEQGEMEERLGKRDRWKGVIGHHRA